MNGANYPEDRDIHHAALAVLAARGSDRHATAMQRFTDAVDLLIFRLVHSRSNGIHDSQFEDMVSEARAEAIAGLDHFDPARGTRYGTFIFPRILGALRRVQRSHGRETVLPTHDLASPDHDEDGLIYNDKWKRLTEAMNRLDRRDAEVLKRVYLDNQTTVEIGRELGISKQRVGQIRDRAVARLRNLAIHQQEQES